MQDGGGGNYKGEAVAEFKDWCKYGLTENQEHASISCVPYVSDQVMCYVRELPALEIHPDYSACREPLGPITFLGPESLVLCAR